MRNSNAPTIGRVPWLSLAVALLLVAAWEFLARGRVVSPPGAPAPSPIAAAFVNEMASGELGGTLVPTLTRVTGGVVELECRATTRPLHRTIAAILA